MPRFEITTTVTYTYDVEADSLETAEKLGWEYEDYLYTGTVEDIEVYEYQEDEDEEEESENE